MASIVQLTSNNKISDGIIEPEKSKKILLVETLKPLWRLTEFTGVLFDWGGNLLASSSTSSFMNATKKIRNILTTSIALFFLASYGMFMVYRTVFGVVELQSDSLPFIPYLIISTMFAIPLVNSTLNLLLLTLLRKKLAKFIEDFHSFECDHLFQSKDERLDVFRKRRRNGYILTVCTNFTLFLSYSYIFYEQDSFNFFFTGNKEICSIFPKSMLLTFEVISVFFVMVYQILVDLIPCFVYYHVGATLDSIHDEINTKSEVIFSAINSNIDNEDEVEEFFKNRKKEDSHNRTLLRIWSKYNKGRQLLKRADALFGLMLLLDFGIKFFMVCLLSYELLTSSKRNPASAAVLCFFVMVTYIIRLVNNVSLMSKVQESREMLASQIFIHLNNYMLDMDAQTHKIFFEFKFQVTSDQLAASPMGLFTVNPALLLTMLSLVVTYLIILIQIN